MEARRQNGTAEQAPGDGSETSAVVRRNIKALVEVRREMDRRKSVQERIADTITAFTGSMTFVFVHAVFYGAWLAVNAGVIPGVEPWDPFPFVMLAMIASVEAIFLSTFVLISQNRMAAMADQRAELDLQISLLSEHEITRLVELVDGISRQVGASRGTDPHLEELKRDVHPEDVLKEMERGEKEVRS